MQRLQPRVIRGTVIFGVEVPIRSGKRIRRWRERILRRLNVLTIPPECAANVVIPSVLGEKKSHLSPPLPSVRHSERVCTVAARSSQLWLRALAVTTATRSNALPDIPPVGEFVPGYEAGYWFSVGAPKATPAKIVERLNTEINAGLADSKITARLADLGGAPLALSPTDFGKLIAAETEKWAKVIKFAGIKRARVEAGHSITPHRPRPARRPAGARH